MGETINLATKYAPRINQTFTAKSLLKGRLSNEYSFIGARTVRIYTIKPVPMNSYNRSASANRYGTPTEVGDNVQELTMRKEDSFSATIDKTNEKDRPINMSGKFMAVQMNEEVIPNYDRYCFNELAHQAGMIVGNSAAISASNVIARLSAGRKHLIDHRANLRECTLWVGTEMFNALIDTDQFKNLEKIGSKAIAQGQVGEIFGSPVVEVPADLLPANVNFIWSHKRSATAPAKIWDNKVHVDPPGISGHLCEGLFYYDLFVLAAKADGVYVDVTTGSGKGEVLSAPSIAAATGVITPTGGATVKFTTDGSDPRYSITAQVGTNAGAVAGTIVKAYQYKAGAFPSPVATVEITGG